MTQILTKSRPRLTLKQQTIAALFAIVSAVLLPQFFHTVGSAVGMGSQLGEMLLPMHFPILLVGFFAGPLACAGAGLLAPVVSFLVNGMPRAELLPFMIVELCVYGLCTGLLRNHSMPTICKLLVAQFVGRFARAAMILSAVYLFENQAVQVSIIWNSISAGMIGLILQWVLLPLMVFYVEKTQKNDL